MKINLKKIFFIILCICSCIIIYWLGLIQSKTKLKEEQNLFNIQINQLNTKLTLTEYYLHFNKARYLMHKALQNIEHRNFGLANSNLKETFIELNKINPNFLGIDMESFELLKKNIDMIDLNITVNYEEQKTKIFFLTEKLDNLLIN